MSISAVYLTEIISDITETLNLKDTKHTVKNFDVKAQNYFGELIPICLHIRNEGSDESDLHLVIKLAPTDEKFRISGALTQFFAKEIYAYDNLLTVYNNLQEILSLPYFTAPKCYYTCSEYCKEVIVLKDMRSDNYKPFLNGMLDILHIKEALISLAKFHALSFILKAKMPEKYSQFTKVFVPLTGANNERFMVILEDRLSKAIDKFQRTKYEKLLENLKLNYIQLVERVAISVTETCICHGDIWKENILFQYKDNKVPVSACLIDYQTVRLSSPAYDLLFLITTSTDSTLRRDHFMPLIDLYYDTFAKMLQCANLEPTVIYSKENLDKDLVAVGPACLIIANTALWLANGLQQEGHVRSKIVLKTEEDLNKASEKYKMVVMSIIEDYNKHGYLSTINDCESNYLCSFNLNDQSVLRDFLFGICSFICIEVSDYIKQEEKT